MDDSVTEIIKVGAAVIAGLIIYFSEGINKCWINLINANRDKVVKDVFKDFIKEEPKANISVEKLSRMMAVNRVLLTALIIVGVILIVFR
jgi:hypothetical protein